MEFIGMLLPGVIMALVFGYWEHRFEIRGISPDAPYYSLNQVLIVLSFAIMLGPLVLYAALYVRVDVNSTAMMSILAMYSVWLLHRPVKRLMKYLAGRKIAGL